ncbi:MAG: DUF5663 domain-containing protein [bacterium]|nr:DUF5663 domain-containing protein [bacterium]
MADPKLAENIIQLLGLQALPDEEKVKLVERMAALVERRLIVRLANELGEEDTEKLEALGEGSEAAAAFLREKFSNLDAMALEEIENVKREAIEAAKAVGAQ